MKNIGYLDSNTAKGQIIQILSDEWPLTAKEIHEKLKQKHQKKAAK